MSAADWNAVAYHRVSSPQFEWGRRVLDRLALGGHERVLDVGCGTGRLTAVLAARLPRGRVAAVDRSAAMLREAAAHLCAAGVRLVRASADALPFQPIFDVVFSTATFHWVLDHPKLFASLAGVLAPGGRLHAQCGGGPNLARLRGLARGLMAEPLFCGLFEGWEEPWHYATDVTTARRLEDAGFLDVRAGLEETPVGFPDAAAYESFARTVCLHPYLNRLPTSLQAPFVSRLVSLAAEDNPPFTLDYWRLNIEARRPGHG